MDRIATLMSRFRKLIWGASERETESVPEHDSPGSAVSLATSTESIPKTTAIKKEVSYGKDYSLC